MANQEHLALLEQGTEVWNAWRRENTDIRPDLSGADHSEADLREVDLSGVDFSGADLRKTNFMRMDFVMADFRGADLREANLSGAMLFGADLFRADLVGAHLLSTDFRGADLREANLSGANLSEANFGEADLSGADLREANLSGANLVQADLTNADITDCRIYGVSAWGLKLEGTKQQNLLISTHGEPKITVDNIEVGQFIYLLLHNQKIRDVIDTIGRKGVLLLGSFTEGRIEILKRLRKELGDLGFVPMVFDFDKPETKDFTETVRLLASLSHFVIVDLTNPKSSPLELQAIVPDTMIPVVPILEKGQSPFSMFVDLQNKRDWVLDVIIYPSVDRLIEVLETEIVRPAELKFNELLAKRTEQLRVRSV